MKIIGHHTCSSEGDIHEIEKKGPFLSTHVENEREQHKFLGTGYYFWDNNIGMAHSHGQANYRRRYYIYEAELELEDDSFLDLAGNRIDMLRFQEIMELLAKVEETNEWGIAQFITFLEKKKMFDYGSVRAIDTSINPKEVIPFVPERKNFINLNPIFIVCLKDGHLDTIKSFKHIRTFPK